MPPSDRRSGQARSYCGLFDEQISCRDRFFDAGYGCQPPRLPPLGAQCAFSRRPQPWCSGFAHHRTRPELFATLSR